MDTNNTVANSTPLKPDLLDQVHHKNNHHLKFSNALLVFAFALFVSSLGFWMQSNLLQPPTKASQKIIETTRHTPTPTLTPTAEIPETQNEQ